MKGCIRTTKSSSSTARVISTMRSRTATSANTPTSAAPQACSIISTPNAAIARRSLPIVRRLRRICSLSNNFARRWERGIYHDHITSHFTDHRSRLFAWSRRDARSGLHARGLQLGKERESDDVVLVPGIEVRNAGAFHDPAGPDVARAGTDRA